MLASELLELLEKRYPDKCALQEHTAFESGERAAIQKLIHEIKTEVDNARVDRTHKVSV